MKDCTLEFTSQASLCALGMQMQKLALWRTVEQHVRIRQKVIHHTPLEKLLDCLINILAGGVGLVEINTRVRPDRAMQRAFGRQCCAEQSTISDTLNACTAENVAQLRLAHQAILRQHGQSYRHDYQASLQLLDVDMTGLPAGRLGEGVQKGYFPKQKNCRGRQLGRVLATHYEEILVDHLFAGKRQLDRSLPELLQAAEELLELDEPRRQHTIVRVDGGGGIDENINAILGRGYHLLIKVKNWRRAKKLAASVSTWYPDPRVTDRQVGWVEQLHPYVQPTRQLALRKSKQDGSWSYHALVFTLSDEMLFQLSGQPVPSVSQPQQVLLAALYAYDRRSGGVETQNRGDKQGLGLNRRNKRRFAAQEMLVLLAQLAHNLIIWTRNQLSPRHHRLQAYGIQRMVRDVLHIAGLLIIDAQEQIQTVVLNRKHPYAAAFCEAYPKWFRADELSLNLGKN